MATSILSIGQSALAAAQVGLSTTGHNIANAATPGFSRQIVVQGAALPQSFGFGFMGQGTEISTVKRVYSEFLGAQVNTAQASKSALDSYYSQIKQIDNLLADPAAGMSPALQGFFSGIQEMASNPASVPSRQAALSSAETLASRFNSMASRLKEIEQGVNSQVTASVTVINTYAKQIAKLNDAITVAQGATGKAPNDLLDQRDQLILDLNKEIKATVVKQGDGAYNVFIGNGQPLVVGVSTFGLTTAISPSNPERIEVAYQTAAGSVIVSENSLAGGKLGGLLEFRSKTLEPAQKSLDDLALGLATTFNAQHVQGRDLNGDLGGTFFSIPAHRVFADASNTGAAVIDTAISDASALTGSDYRLTYTDTPAPEYTLTRLSDGTASTFATLPQTVDGMTLNLTGLPDDGDGFLIRPPANAAAGIAVAISDPRQIAAAAALPAVPVGTSVSGTNGGDVVIGAATIDSSNYATLAAPVTFAYQVDPVNGDGFIVSTAVTVTDPADPLNPMSYAAGDIVPYVEGATISFGGISFTLSSPTSTPPADGDGFTVAANPFGIGDNRNALLLSALQTANSMGDTTYQGAYSLLVSTIGNKTRELDVTSTAAGSMLTEARGMLQSESGVNLDEEATNLLRYQQAYQAAGKVMQVASEMFDVLLSLGR